MFFRQVNSLILVKKILRISQSDMCRVEERRLIRRPKVKVKVKPLSCVQLFAIPWTVAHQAAPSMGFSKPEYWSGLPFPSPGDLPDPGIKPWSPVFQANT